MSETLKDISLTDYIESIIAPQVRSYVQEVIGIADEFRRSGIPREIAGLAGKTAK